MSTEQYLKSVNFIGGLNDSQLTKEIQENVIINKVCYGIRTIDDDVFIDFDDNLLIAEKTELDNLISNYVFQEDDQTLQIDNIEFVNPAERTAIYTITSKVLSANIDTLLDNWSAVQTSNKINFNISTGIFTPEDGYYSMSIRQVVESNDVFNELGLRLLDDLNDTI